MRAGGGRPATASVTRNGSNVGGNRGDTHYTHTRACTRMCAHARTHRHTDTHTCASERARASSLSPPSLSSSLLPSASFSTSSVLLALLRSDHPLLAVSLTIFLCTFTLFSPRVSSLSFSPISLLLSSLISAAPTVRRLSPYLSSYSSLLQCCRVGCAAASLAALSAALHGRGRDVLCGVCSPLCASRETRRRNRRRGRADDDAAVASLSFSRFVTHT